MNFFPGFGRCSTSTTQIPPRKTGGLSRISVFWTIDFDCQPSRPRQFLLCFLDDIVLVGVLFHTSSSSPSKFISYRAHKPAKHGSSNDNSYHITSQHPFFHHVFISTGRLSVCSFLCIFTHCVFPSSSPFHVSCPIIPISSPHRHSYIPLCLLRYPH